MNGHAHDFDAGLVAIEHFLHGLLDVLDNFKLIFKEDRVHLLASDHLAHRAFGDLENRQIRVTRLKKEVFSCMRLNAVLHVKHHVDDVFIIGEHQRFS